MGNHDYTTRTRRGQDQDKAPYTGRSFGRRPQEEDKPSPEATLLIERIETYCELESGWDSRHAKPLSKAAARCAKAAVIALDDNKVEFRGVSLGVADDVEIRFEILGYRATVVVDGDGWDWSVSRPLGGSVSGDYGVAAASDAKQFAREASTALFQQIGLT